MNNAKTSYLEPKDYPRAYPVPAASLPPDVTVDWFSIEFPETSGHSAKVFANQQHCVPVRVYIKLIDKENNNTVVLEDLYRTVFLYDKASNKSLATSADIAGSLNLLPPGHPTLCPDLIAYFRPNAFCHGVYPAGSEGLSGKHPSDATVLNFYVQALAQGTGASQFQIGAYFNTPTHSVTTEENNIPLLSLSIQPAINYADPAQWNVDVGAPSILSLTGRARAENFDLKQATLECREFVLAHTDSLPGVSPITIPPRVSVQPLYTVRTDLALSPQAVGVAYVNENEGQSRLMLWNVPGPLSGITHCYVRSQSGITSTDNTHKNLSITQDIPLMDVSTSSRGMVVLQTQLRMGKEAGFKFAGGSHDDVLQVRIRIEDNYGHHQEANLTFSNALDGKPRIS